MTLLSKYSNFHSSLKWPMREPGVWWSSPCQKNFWWAISSTLWNNPGQTLFKRKTVPSDSPSWGTSYSFTYVILTEFHIHGLVNLDQKARRQEVTVPPSSSGMAARLLLVRLNSVASLLLCVNSGFYKWTALGQTLRAQLLVNIGSEGVARSLRGSPMPRCYSNTGPCLCLPMALSLRPTPLNGR